MMNDTPSYDPAAATVPEDPLRPTPRLMIEIVMDVLEKQHQSMTSMRGSLTSWTLPAWERQQLEAMLDATAGLTLLNHKTLDKEVKGWPNLLDDRPIRESIQRYAGVMRRAAEGVRRDCSVTRVLAGPLSPTEKHQEELLRGLATAIDIHCASLGDVVEALGGQA